MKKRQIDKIKWRNRANNAYSKVTNLIESVIPNDDKKALRHALFVYKLQTQYLPFYHKDFLKIQDYLLTLYMYERLNRPKEALQIYFHQIIIQKVNDDSKNRLIQIYQNISNIYQHELNDINLSNFFREKELKIRIKYLKFSNEKPLRQCEDIAKIYSKLGDAENQKLYLLKQIEEFKGFINDKPSYFTNEIARIYKQLKMYNQSLEFHLKSVDFAIENKEKLLATTYDSIAGDYRNLKNYDKSLEYHFKSIENMIELKGDKQGEYHFLRIFHYRTALTYFEMNDFLNAKFHVLKSIEIAKQYNGVDYPDTKELLEEIKQFENQNHV
jgi:Tetratricopeptide repeat